jgi:hypothetical protein
LDGPFCHANLLALQLWDNSSTLLRGLVLANILYSLVTIIVLATVSFSTLRNTYEAVQRIAASIADPIPKEF